MKYPDSGGLSAAGRVRREQVRLQAAEMFEHGAAPVLPAAGSSGASSAHCPSVIVEPG